MPPHMPPPLLQRASSELKRHRRVAAGLVFCWQLRSIRQQEKLSRWGWPLPASCKLLSVHCYTRASQVVRRLPPPDAQRLRTSALCLAHLAAQRRRAALYPLASKVPATSGYASHLCPLFRYLSSPLDTQTEQRPTAFPLSNVHAKMHANLHAKEHM